VATKLFSPFKAAPMIIGSVLILCVLVTTGVAGAMQLSIAFVVDASGSMKGAKLQAAKDAVKSAVNTITSRGSLKDQGIEISLFSFSGCGNCTLKAPITQDSQRVLAGLNFGASGGTPLAFSLTKAADYLFKEGVGKEGRIILLSDGGESCRGNPVEAAERIHKSEKTLAMFPKNWHFDKMPNAKARMSVIKEALRYMRRVGEQLKTTDPKLSALLIQYADEIWKMDLYYSKQCPWPNFIAGNPAASWSNLWQSMTLYGYFFGYRAFQQVDAQRTDADLGEVASTLIHETHHSHLNGEVAAYTLQWRTFKPLKVYRSHLRDNTKGYLKKKGYTCNSDGTVTR
jgi:hypothetical protein